MKQFLYFHIRRRHSGFNYYFFLLYFVGLAVGSIWQDGTEIKSYFTKEELHGGRLIHGGFFKSFTDHLTLLEINSNSNSTTTSSDNLIYVGARDAIYMLNNQDLTIHSKIEWRVSNEDREQCQIKGQKDADCFNYIRILHGPFLNYNYDEGIGGGRKNLTQNNNNKVYIMCGTNAWKPKCRYYSIDLQYDQSLEELDDEDSSKDARFIREISGQGMVPYTPYTPSTSLFSSTSGNSREFVYTATVGDFGGTDSLIYREPLRTEQYDLKHLNNPTFISSLEYDDSVLFFFRENAMEYSNCGTAIYSRVARVCSRDNGSKKHKDRFSSFLKARLNCSIEGDIPFYLDYIQGATKIFKNRITNEDMFYAVFTTGDNTIKTSAVCSFQMKDLVRVFNESPFKSQTNFNSFWLPVYDIPSPRPGLCSSNEGSPSNTNVQFLKSNPLLDESIQGQVVVTFTNNVNFQSKEYQREEENEKNLNKLLKNLKFTAIEIDNSEEIRPYHILYVGTESGKVLKVVLNASPSANTQSILDKNENSIISQVWEVFTSEGNKDIMIKKLKLTENNRKLIVQTENNMTIINIDQCNLFNSRHKGINSCYNCISIRDPHCAWDENNSKCITKDPLNDDKRKDINLIQDVQNGHIHLCPTTIINDNLNEDTENEKNILSQDLLNENNNGKSNDNNNIDFQSNNIDKETASNKENEEENSIINHNLIANGANNDGVNNRTEDYKSLQIQASSIFNKNIEEGKETSGKVIIIATVLSGLLSMFIGFLIGFFISKYIYCNTNEKIKNNKNNSNNINTNSNNLIKSSKLLLSSSNNGTTKNKNKPNNNTNTIGAKNIKNTKLNNNSNQNENLLIIATNTAGGQGNINATSTTSSSSSSTSSSSSNSSNSTGSSLMTNSSNMSQTQHPQSQNLYNDFYNNTNPPQPQQQAMNQLPPNSQSSSSSVSAGVGGGNKNNIDFVINLPTSNPNPNNKMLNNSSCSYNNSTLEKTVKKIYI